MTDFRKLAHLQEQLGEDRFNALISSDNTGKVKDFCDTLIAKNSNTMPTEMKIGDRTYEILGFLKEGEGGIICYEMVRRAKEMNAHLGQDDGQYLLDHQQDIPESLRGKVCFAFTDWSRPDDSGGVFCVEWCDGRWVRNRCWDWLGRGGRSDNVRVLRRK
jgi:hypothetical protein